MNKHTLIGGVTAGIATMALAACLGTGAAHAATTKPRLDVSFKNISITSVNGVKLCGKLTDPSLMSSGDGQVTDVASWAVAQSVSAFNNNTWASLGYVIFDPTGGCTAFFPGMDLPGTYHAYPYPAVDVENTGNWNTQNTATFGIKYGSGVSLSVTRKGSHVSVRAYAKRYNAISPMAPFGSGVGRWQPWVGHYVTIYQLRAGKWVAVKSMLTGKTGWTGSYTFTYAATREYKAVTSQTSIIWGSTSSTVTK